MSLDIFGDRTFSIMGKALDVYSLRHRVSANNIANVNTPGFKRAYVPFESELGGMLQEGGLGKRKNVAKKIEDMEISPRVDYLTESREDGNNVDIEQEVAEMTKNQIRYTGISKIVKSKLDLYRYVISEGRR